MFTFPTLNRASPQALGLRYCWPMFNQATLGKELVRGANATLTTTTTILGPQSPILTPTYNGTSHYGTATIDLGDVNKLTVCLWMYIATLGSGDHMAIEYTANTASDNAFLLDVYSTGRLYCGVDWAAKEKGKYLLLPAINTWHHYTILLDRSVAFGCVAAYLDGRSVALTNYVNGTASGNFNATDTLYFMARTGTSLWQAGGICDVRIYPGKLLSDAEAWALYDPRTRWDLYMPMEDQQKWAVAATVAGGPPAGSLALLGVGR